MAATVGSESVDSILAEVWKSRGIEPAPVCSDREFRRRTSLDIIGRVPTLEEILYFERTSDRAELINRLLDHERFAHFWSDVWAANLNGYGDAFDSDRKSLRNWLEQAFAADVPFDTLTRRLITTHGSSSLKGPANFLLRHPEEPTVKVSRLFLGVRLDCARCHDHPFDRWTQKDFQLMNRFFKATEREESSSGNIRLVDVVMDEEEERPRFLTGARPRTTRWRSELALFVTHSKPFARAFSNRL